ncbi:MAG TPA: MFS transporter [Candidatus Paceibacterota bacterium]|nr:MFS transporter [Verrucomicrobiota bacterium]HRY48576.1 MFS transporter [Candidatus Paceibacterota bacterium]
MNATPKSGAELRSWQLRIFWLLWGAYASYYLCRVNFAVAQPMILREYPDWTSAQVGMIPSIYAIFYAAGQIINGTLGQRYGARRMMTVALLVASITNLLFSLTSSYVVMLGLWSINGFAQSAGWSLLIQTISNWNSSQRRGTVIGLVSTCYQVGNVASWLLAGMLCEAMGWRAAFAVPSLILIPMAAVFYLFLRDTPEEVGFGPVRDDIAVPQAAPQAGSGHAAMAEAGGWQSTWNILVLTLSNRVLWILAIGFFCMNSVRYTFMNWSVQYMADFQGRSIKGSAFTAVVIPLIGSLGAISAGWASDNLFGKRRAPVCAIMLVGLAGVCGLFSYIPQGQWMLATAVLGVAGFLIYGPDMLMSGAATVDVSHPRAASIATGLTMCFGATGAIFSGAGIGWLRDRAQGNWGLVFWVLAGLSLVSALLMVSIWNARPKGSK